ncbi:MAG: F0F1 ATP synthase subunit delta [Pseudomonadota bacterium]|nr:F0F1 ATP synthase subunit delta [Pseudomonadota bacterium]
MATDTLTIARPYAEALIRIARDGKSYDAWARMLSFATSIVEDPQMSRLLGNPDLSDKQKNQILLSVMGQDISPEGKNLIQLLLDNGRLQFLPEIYRMYEILKDDEQGVLEADIYTAFPLTKKQCEVLTKHLENRYSRHVNVSVHEDVELIGGVKIVIGDNVIDATVKGQLQKMAFTLQR